MDSFDVFQLEESTTNEEIREAFKNCIEKFCGENRNAKNRDGEYLWEIYQEHYKRLINPEEKKKLIEERRNKMKESLTENDKKLDSAHGIYESTLVIPKALEVKQNYLVTSVNQEIIKQYSEMDLKKKFSLRKVRIKDTYVVIGEDCSLLFTDSMRTSYAEATRINEETGEVVETLPNTAFYSLYDSFTRQCILGNYAYAWFSCPWDRGQVFEVQGVLSIAFLASKIFPNALVDCGKVKMNDFRLVYNIISQYLNDNSDYVASLFKDVDREEVTKRMKW